MDEPAARASDDDREHAVLVLREHLLAGRLTLEEFSERVEAAYRAGTAADLAATRTELPATAAPTKRRRRPTRLTLSFFAHVIRRGRLRLPRRTLVLASFSDVDLDLRDAEIASARTDVHVLLTFGNVDVYVPEGVDVELTGLTVFGHRRDWGRDAAPADAPLVRVRVLAVFGTVDLWRVPSDLRGDYGKLIKDVRRRHRELPG